MKQYTYRPGYLPYRKPIWRHPIAALQNWRKRREAERAGTYTSWPRLMKAQAKHTEIKSITTRGQE